MKLVFTLCVLFSSVSAFANAPFPEGPNNTITPGSLCTKPDERRYPEKIPYCNRAVGSDLKKEIIRTYDEKFGYQIESMDRQAFKIDHYIPLCMGGSNEPSNLWPQHESVYVHTDELEFMACNKMAEGKLKQARAIEIIKAAKADLSQAANLLQEVESL